MREQLGLNDISPILETGQMLSLIEVISGDVSITETAGYSFTSVSTSIMVTVTHVAIFFNCEDSHGMELSYKLDLHKNYLQMNENGKVFENSRINNDLRQIILTEISMMKMSSHKFEFTGRNL
jgi:hypothetical protein